MTKVAMVVWNEFVNDARVLKEAQTLATAGYVVTVFALNTPGKTATAETLENNLHVRRVNRSPLWRFRKSRNISKTSTVSEVNNLNNGRISLLRLASRIWTHTVLLSKMVADRPDVIHAHDVNTLPTAWLAATITRAKLVYDAHEVSTSREGYGRFKKAVGVIENFILPRVTASITTTSTRAKYFSRLYKIDRPRVIQNRPRYTQVAKSNIIREQLGLTEEWPIIVYQGGVQSGRGLEKLVKCAVDLADSYIVLIGGGRLTDSLIQLRDGLGLQAKVHFIPTVSLSQLPNYTASADIAVQPIENTCFNHFSTDSNKLFEYIIAGLPVVASNFPEIRSIVREYDVGFLVADRSSEELVDKLNALIQNSTHRDQISRNTKLAAKHLSWESQEHILLDIYSSMAAREKKRDEF